MLPWYRCLLFGETHTDQGGYLPGVTLDMDDVWCTFAMSFIWCVCIKYTSQCIENQVAFETCRITNDFFAWNKRFIVLAFSGQEAQVLDPNRGGAKGAIGSSGSAADLRIQRMAHQWHTNCCLKNLNGYMDTYGCIWWIWWIISSIDNTSHEASHYIALHFEATSLCWKRTLQSVHKIVQIRLVGEERLWNSFESLQDDLSLHACMKRPGNDLELYEPLISSLPFELPSESNNCVACSKLPHGTAVG